MAGYLVFLHVIVVPEELAVARVELGGHSVPEDKIRQRFRRLWALIVAASSLADETVVVENVAARGGQAFRFLMSLRFGRVVSKAELPTWLPTELKLLVEERS